MGVKHSDPQRGKKNHFSRALILAHKFVIQSDSSRIFKLLGSARLACTQTPTLFSCSMESFALGLNFDSYLYYYFISHAFIMIPSIFTILDTLLTDSEWLLWVGRTMSSISRFVTPAFQLCHSLESSENSTVMWRIDYVHSPCSTHKHMFINGGVYEANAALCNCAH